MIINYLAGVEGYRQSQVGKTLRFSKMDFAIYLEMAFIKTL